MLETIDKIEKLNNLIGEHDFVDEPEKKMIDKIDLFNSDKLTLDLLSLLPDDEISKKLKSPNEETKINNPFFFALERRKALFNAIFFEESKKNLLVTGNSCVGKSNSAAYIYLRSRLLPNKFLSIYVGNSKKTSPKNSKVIRNICQWFYQEIKSSIKIQILMNVFFANIDAINNSNIEQLLHYLIKEAKSKDKKILFIQDQFQDGSIEMDEFWKITEWIDICLLVTTSTETDLIYEMTKPSNARSFTEFSLNDMNETLENKGLQNSIIKTMLNLDNDDFEKNEIWKRFRKETKGNFHVLYSFTE